MQGKGMYCCEETGQNYLFPNGSRELLAHAEKRSYTLKKKGENMTIRSVAIPYLCVILTGMLYAGNPEGNLKGLQYDKDLIPPSEYKTRRDSVMHMIGTDAAAILYSAPERMRNGDVDYVYRQSDNFYYLTGFTEPNAILILAPKGLKINTTDSTTDTVNEILFVQERNPSDETWTGRRYGPDGAMKLIGIQYSETNDQFKKMFRRLIYSGIHNLYVEPITTDIAGEIRDLIAPVQDWIDNKKTRSSLVELRDPDALINKMREIKSPAEIAMIKKATDISVIAHKQAMMSVEPGMYEYQLSAVYQYVFQSLGAEFYGYPCINGSGENSVILHYETNRKQIADGDVCLSDCAAEYHGYSSDITRTYPANGTFTKEQKQIYQIVLQAQNTAIAMIKPGAVWRDISAAADSVLEEGLLSLGLMKTKSMRELRKFYMHGLGHPIGLDVHDAGGRVLEAGMLTTVEPGIYIREGMDGVDPKYYNIGVRIEDDILVTPTGHTNLSEGAPREIQDIEALMKKKGIGNQPIR